MFYKIINQYNPLVCHNHTHKVVAALLAATILTSCAGTWADPAPPFSSVNDDFTAEGIQQARGSLGWNIMAATTLSEEYETRYADNLRAQQQWFDIPLITLALATVASIAYGANDDLTGGFALGAGVVGTGSTYFKPSASAAYYLKGRQGLQCVVQKTAKLQAFMKSNGTIDTTRVAPQLSSILSNPNLNALLAPEATSENETLDAKLVAAQEELEKAKKAATKIRTTYINQLNESGDVVAQAISTVEGWVATGVARQPVSYADALTRISTAIKDAAAKAASIDEEVNRLEKTKTSTQSAAASTARGDGTEGEQRVAKKIQDIEQAVIALNDVAKEAKETLPDIPKIHADIVTCAQTPGA